jgi:hypothetical protein
MGLESVVEELGVTDVASRTLERQGNQVPEPGARKNVLAGEQPVVGVDPERGTASHRGRQDHEPEPPCLRGRNRVGEEEPDMGAVARSGSLDRRVEAEGTTRNREGLQIGAPRAAVEINRKQPATVIGKQRIDPDDLAPLKVREQLAVVESDERLVAAIAAAHLGLPQTPGCHSFAHRGE